MRKMMRVVVSAVGVTAVVGWCSVGGGSRRGGSWRRCGGVAAAGRRWWWYALWLSGDEVVKMVRVVVAGGVAAAGDGVDRLKEWWRCGEWWLKLEVDRRSPETRRNLAGYGKEAPEI
ncbi:hypothetical protein Tco_0401797 [Tanacetum coccineum]